MPRPFPNGDCRSAIASLACSSQARSGGAGDEIRGHEFHYSTLLEAGTDAPLVELFDSRNEPLGTAGARRGNVTGTYFHALALARPE